jgi:hypothetical protein
MSALNIIFGWQMQVVDNSTNQTVVNASQSGMTLAGTAYFCDQYYQVSTSGSTISLPSTTIWSLFIQNKGSNVVTAGWTSVNPGGNFSATSAGSILPGGVFIYHQTVETSAGLQAIVLTANIATTPCSVFVGY